MPPMCWRLLPVPLRSSRIFRKGTQPLNVARCAGGGAIRAARFALIAAAVHLGRNIPVPAGASCDDPHARMLLARRKAARSSRDRDANTPGASLTTRGADSPAPSPAAPVPGMARAPLSALPVSVCPGHRVSPLRRCHSEIMAPL